MGNFWVFLSEDWGSLRLKITGFSYPKQINPKILTVYLKFVDLGRLEHRFQQKKF